ncbi:hypothetical protein SDC9_54938 [bioreactor metagenome]|uniref:Uncharacterized protein n=1 Tax=bioreactor metagenome TaxID=1076179 RepID=A0A644X3B5_9ZZZZ
MGIAGRAAGIGRGRVERTVGNPPQHLRRAAFRPAESRASVRVICIPEFPVLSGRSVGQRGGRINGLVLAGTVRIGPGKIILHRLPREQQRHGLLPVGRNQPGAVGRGVAVLLLVAALHRHPKLRVANQKTAAAVLRLGDSRVSERLSNSVRSLAEQPSAIQRSPLQLSCVYRLSVCGIQRSKSVRRQIVGAPLIPELSAAIPADFPVGPSGGEFRLNRARSVLQIIGPAPLVPPLGKCSLILCASVLAVLGAVAVIGAVGKRALILHGAVRKIGDPLAGADAAVKHPHIDLGPVGVLGSKAALFAGGKRTLVGDFTAAVQRAGSFIDAAGKRTLIDQDAAIIGASVAGALPVRKVPLVDQGAVLRILDTVSLQDAVLQLSLIHGLLFLFVIVDDHLPGPFRQFLILLPEVGGEKVAQQKRPHEEVNQRDGRSDSQHQQNEKGLGDVEPPRLNIVLTLGRLFQGGGSILKRI